MVKRKTSTLVKSRKHYNMPDCIRFETNVFESGFYFQGIL